MSEHETRFQFYGRRKGKPLRRHHLQLVEELLPRLRFNAETSPAGTGPTWLEIGFGGGEHLAHQAELHPGIRFIGAEPFVNGVAKLLAEIERRQLTNVQIHDDDARYLLPRLADSSIERVYLLYPDPWPKVRQNKRRFVNADNLRQIARVLKPDGLFMFASDIPDYVDWTLEHVSHEQSLKLLNHAGEPFENWQRTRYEAKAIREGRVPQYLTFEKRA